MIVFRERVLPSALNLILPVLLFPSVYAVMLPINAPFALPVASILTIVFVVFVVSSAPVIELTENVLKARGASIERKFLGRATVIPKNEVFSELGTKLDARAWLAIQASVRGLVKIEVLDPKDPTPYWLISTRRPEELAKYLNR